MLQDDRVNHQGQPIALVIAETLEQANHAATLVRVTYAAEAGITDIGRVEPVQPTRKRPTRARPGHPRRGAAIPKERSRPPRSRSTRPT